VGVPPVTAMGGDHRGRDAGKAGHASRRPPPQPGPLPPPAFAAVGAGLRLPTGPPLPAPRAAAVPPAAPNPAGGLLATGPATPAPWKGTIVTDPHTHTLTDCPGIRPPADHADPRLWPDTRTAPSPAPPDQEGHSPVYPECGEPLVRQAPPSWPPAARPAPAYRHLDGQPLCARSSGHTGTGPPTRPSAGTRPHLRHRTGCRTRRRPEPRRP
jgi:hypothetical protein